MLEAQAGHDPQLGADPARAHLVEGRPEGGDQGKYTNKPPYVGSGPYKAVEWKKSSLRAPGARTPYWWGPKPKIDEIYFMAYTNSDTLLQDLKAGTIDGGVDLLVDADEAAPERARHHRPRRSPSTASTTSASTATTGPARATRC